MLNAVNAHRLSKQAVREAATICPAPCKLTLDLLTLKVVSESRMTWATSVPILVFLGLSLLDLDPMYATDIHTSDRQTERQTDRRQTCASGCVVEWRTCNREVAGSNFNRGYFAPRSTQPSIPPGSVNEYQLRLGRQR